MGEYMETGILSLNLTSLSTDHKFNLEFNLRKIEKKKSNSTPIDKKKIEQSKKIIVEEFSKLDGKSLPMVLKKLELLLDKKRNEWDLLLLRTLAKTTLDISDNRKLTKLHEEKWLNVLGYFMRPGFGFVDDKKIVSRIFNFMKKGRHFINYLPSEVQEYIFWRRVSGGLSEDNNLRYFINTKKKLSQEKRKI